MSIALVAGLGNPGPEYEHSRHNVGWTVVDRLAARHGLSWKRAPAFAAELARWDLAPGRTIWLAKPQTYMNDSGRAISAILRYHKLAPEAVAAVYDDLGIEFGLVKVSVAGSDGGHNGVASLIEHLGTGFARYRIGIGPKEPPEMDLKDFVLASFTSAQLTLLNQKTDPFVQGLELLLQSGPDRAMNQLNRREPIP